MATSLPGESAPGPQTVRATASFPAPADPVAKAKARATGDFAMKPSSNAAAVVVQFVEMPFGEQDPWALAEELKASMEQVQAGDMGQCEAMLMGQAIALQSIFTHMSRRVLKQEYQRHMEAFFAMALKAQNQCRMTLETLNELKHPRQVAFVRADQANIAQQQQVNNSAPPVAEGPRARENGIGQSKQSGGSLELLPDSGASTVAGSNDPQMETLGEVERPEDRRRQGTSG
jgi:hypothetical protein